MLRLGPVLVAGLGYVYSLIRYPHLPSRISLHWGPGGLGSEFDRAVGAVLIPTVVFGLWLVALWADKGMRNELAGSAGLRTLQTVHLILVSLFSAILIGFHILVLTAG